MHTADPSPLARALCAVAADIAGSTTLAREQAADCLWLAGLVDRARLSPADREKYDATVVQARHLINNQPPPSGLQ